jgi:hypothetical protein
MHLTTFAPPRANRALRTPRWQRLIGAMLVARPSLLIAAIALVSAAYLISSGQDDTLVLAWIADAS